jgi:hypothetical protein
MTSTDDTSSKRPLSATFVTGLGATALLALCSFATVAFADGHRDEHRDWRGDRHGYYGGYYGAPPVVYGSPYYYPPPVVYGPGIGINLPGVAIGIR